MNPPPPPWPGGELGDRVVRPAPPRAAGANWRGALVIGCELHARGHLCLGLGDLLVLGASGVLFYPSLTGLYSRRDRFQSPTKNPSAQAAYTEALLLGWRTILLRRTWGGGAEEAGGKVGWKGGRGGIKKREERGKREEKERREEREREEGEEGEER